jgi:hypothetical protein
MDNTKMPTVLTGMPNHHKNIIIHHGHVLITTTIQFIIQITAHGVMQISKMKSLLTKPLTKAMFKPNKLSTALIQQSQLTQLFTQVLKPSLIQEFLPHHHTHHQS